MHDQFPTTSPDAGVQQRQAGCQMSVQPHAANLHGYQSALSWRPVSHSKTAKLRQQADRRSAATAPTVYPAAWKPLHQSAVPCDARHVRNRIHRISSRSRGTTLSTLHHCDYDKPANTAISITEKPVLTQVKLHKLCNWSLSYMKNGSFDIALTVYPTCLLMFLSLWRAQTEPELQRICVAVENMTYPHSNDAYCFHLCRKKADEPSIHCPNVERKQVEEAIQ